MNLEQARFNMIEQQIRPWDVLDQRVLDLIKEVPREQFVPERFRRLAFSDTRIPLDHGEVMMSPKVEARMLQALRVRSDDTALEIGTGSGYVTALLGKLARQVHTVDIHGSFIDQARGKIEQIGIENVTLTSGDGTKGLAGSAPYDVIAVTGSVPILDEALQRQLAVGGRLFVIVGESPVMEARLIIKVDDNRWATECLFETDLPPLIGAPKPESFVF